MFLPPDIGQVQWMLNAETHRPYLAFVTNVYEMLCSYSATHGLPRGIAARESRDAYERRLFDEIRHFELPSAGQPNNREYRLLSADCSQNTTTALTLYQQVSTFPNRLSSEVESFLNTVLDVYKFVVGAARNQRRRARP